MRVLYLIAFAHNHIIQACGISSQLQGDELISIPAQRFDGNISFVLKKLFYNLTCFTVTNPRLQSAFSSTVKIQKCVIISNALKM